MAVVAAVREEDLGGPVDVAPEGFEGGGAVGGQRREGVHVDAGAAPHAANGHHAPIAIAMALCGLFSVQTNWNPFANVGGMVSRNAAGQNKAAAALGLL